jgi:hypothetical protein
MKIKRIPITGEFKKALVAAHGCRCVNCGTLEDIEWHHIVPLSRGGKDVVSNIIPLCHSCHHKGSHGQRLRVKEATLGRHRITDIDRDKAERIFKAYSIGMITDGEATSLLGYSGKTHMADCVAFKEWSKRNGVSRVNGSFGKGGRRKKTVFETECFEDENGQISIRVKKPGDQYWTIEEVSKMLKLPRATVKKCIDCGDLWTCEVNGVLYITKDYLDAFLDLSRKRTQSRLHITELEDDNEVCMDRSGCDRRKS